jgi:LacI family transcriptional regulator
MPRPRCVAVNLDLEWPYKRHASLFAGTQRYAREQGWTSVIDEYVDRSLPQRRTAPLPYDGVIGRASRRFAEKTKRLGVPAVNVWYSSPVWQQLPGVFPDFEAVGRLRAEHLLARGLRQFAVLHHEGRGQKLEAKAFRTELASAGFECNTEKISLSISSSYDSWKKAQRQIDGWMSQWQLPIGVSVGREAAGRMVAQLCHQRGWRVPQDVAIVAGHNEETLCEDPRPSLTSVELGYDRIGYEAARMLDRLMDAKRKRQRKKTTRKKTKQAASPEHIFLPPLGLVVRESTDFYAVNDDMIATALTFIAEQCHGDIHSADVAVAASTHLKTLQRRFRSVLDRSIAAEIRRVRIERAKRELAQGNRPLADIAHDVGFSSSMRMYDIFVRELGVTPRQFRKERQLEGGT